MTSKKVRVLVFGVWLCLSMASFILKAGEDYYTKKEDFKLMCHFLDEGKVNWFMAFLKTADINYKSKEEFTIIHKSCIEENALFLNRIIELRGKDIEYRSCDLEGRNYFYYAVVYKKYFFIDCIVQRLSINEQDKYGRTALHYAVLEGDLMACAILLDKGADVAVKDSKGKRPLSYASDLEGGNKNPIVGLLLARR